MNTRQEIPELILDTATSLFAERGYQGTSLQAIAAEVGIRKPSLLYHFRSKEILRSAVIDRLFSHWRDELPVILEAATSGEDRFDSLVGAVVGFFAEDVDRARLIYRELLDRPDAIRESLKSFIGPWLIILSGYVRNGKKDGSVRPDVDPEAFILSTIQMIVGGVATAHVFGGLFDASASVDRQTAELVRIARTALFTEQHLDSTQPRKDNV